MKFIMIIMVMLLTGAVTAADAQVSVFAKFIRKVAAEKHVTLTEAAEKLYAAGVRGYDCGPDEADIQELARTKLRPINFYYFPNWYPEGKANDYVDRTTSTECLAKA